MEKRDFSLLDIMQLLKKRWWIIVLAAIVVAAGAAFYSDWIYEPTYSSSVSVYVKTEQSQENSASDDVSQVNWALKVVKNYVEILKSNDFMEDLSNTYQSRFPEAWAKKNYTATRLSTKCVTYEAVEETYIFTFTVTTHAKDVSYNIGKIFEELAPQQIIEVTGKDSITIMDSARVASSPSNSKNMMRNTLMGFLVGAVLCFLIVFIIDISDVRIKDEEDLIEDYDIPLLGSVPNFESAKKRGYGYGKK